MNQRGNPGFEMRKLCAYLAMNQMGNPGFEMVAKISTTSWNSLSSKLFQFLVNVVLLNEELIKCILESR
ncbi:hypothetical protein RHGRI_000264 [Rhododendron griersonianum]|uniref:Uncharacterized protein n=1 Tax=Rhododendron griersonianum TaxID=479676 RepID=A0AAV6LFX0_9ERIC|nr:hypothetical protein RHGRI_000264 [Rhododendron griersonianum]KAG5564028.1 hypothetical protein RHGRI_000264 [Rhododendron griersonianum]KAG5564029.1 hypothetical protein RHGRI_000264 [Rhododendron griersonianum]